MNRGGSGKPECAEFRTGSKRSALCQRGLEQTLLALLLGHRLLLHLLARSCFGSGLGSGALMVGLEQLRSHFHPKQHQNTMSSRCGCFGYGQDKEVVPCSGREDL